jgi:LuxR family maltose regulon positive regulatory protein
VRRPIGDQELRSTLPGFADEPLLATKLMVPQPPEWFVTRPRLLDALTEGAQGPLMLLAAPAGTGKTMLLGSWIHSGRHPGPVAWLSLDPDDNDRARFWAYVLAGLRASGAVPSDGSLAHLAPSSAGTGETLIPLLINGLGDLPGPVVLVLDDLHELTDAAILADVEFLLRRAPPQLRMVLVTRADPALRLARLRVAGGLTEVRADELAFSRAETAELVAAFGTALSDAQVTALWRRTEGWAAGLRLAALSLQHHPDPSGFVAAFSGDDRAVADYLIGEVLDRQPDDIREFLLRTSLADRLTGGLADALTGDQDSIRRLRELERTNAFVVPLDPNRTAYRYHQLFAELLRAELRRQKPDLSDLAEEERASYGSLLGTLVGLDLASDGPAPDDTMPEGSEAGLSLEAALEAAEAMRGAALLDALTAVTEVEVVEEAVTQAVVEAALDGEPATVAIGQSTDGDDGR